MPTGYMLVAAQQPRRHRWQIRGHPGSCRCIRDRCVERSTPLQNTTCPPPVCRVTDRPELRPASGETADATGPHCDSMAVRTATGRSIHPSRGMVTSFSGRGAAGPVEDHRRSRCGTASTDLSSLPRAHGPPHNPRMRLASRSNRVSSMRVRAAVLSTTAVLCSSRSVVCGVRSGGVVDRGYLPSLVVDTAGRGSRGSVPRPAVRPGAGQDSGRSTAPGRVTGVGARRGRGAGCPGSERRTPA
ncbi:hypothetical protein JOF55_001234 [Haloactinomyces albus]|uniref:Uncharacterized protein n=1 Tax=Haloactinomyces albus TaxID=1352928 RepID=A0AAE3Z9Z1_9ACTN|nr:hypothetical protein [Haloactinomyces albus]